MTDSAAVDNNYKSNCEHCDKTFTKACHLYTHIRNIHNVEPKLRRKPKLVCPSCHGLYLTYSILREHLVDFHKSNIYREEHTFKNIEDFHSWKESKEKEMRCTYVKSTGHKIGSRKKKTYYVCHRSFKHQNSYLMSQVKGDKAMKSQGAMKLDITCPSTLELCEVESVKIKAVLFFPHLGHECSLSHVKLSKTERNEIAGKIAMGISFEKILDDIRDQVTSVDSFGRLSLINRQDLRNITKEFSLQKYIKLHENDAISVQSQGSGQKVEEFSDKITSELSSKDKIISELVKQNRNQEQFQDNMGDLITKLNIITKVVLTNSLSPAAKDEANKLLDKVIKVVVKGNSFPVDDSVKNEPVNKKIEKQIRFVSTKKKTSKTEGIQKPSTSDIQSTLTEWTEKKQSDHQYAKSMGIFN